MPNTPTLQHIPQGMSKHRQKGSVIHNGATALTPLVKLSLEPSIFQFVIEI